MFDIDDIYQPDGNLILKKEILFKAYLKYASNTKKEKNLSIDNISLQEMDLLFKIFDGVFNPDNIAVITDETYLSLKKKLFDDIEQSMNKFLSKESIIISNLLKATIRTNFYQSNTVIKKSSDFSVILKFDSKILQHDSQFSFEFFVYNRFFEGVHFRENKFSRGGLRLSSREDYFNEIFDLAKTQKYKNSIIIEGGAKGGFIVKKDYDIINLNPTKEQKNTSYKGFLNCMISLMDNKNKSGHVITKSYVVALDKEDSYLFIAADKGTSDFLDCANSISSINNYWLKDAFAAGSSSGYNHKSLQVTTKGALCAMKHHALHLNIDPENMTVVGVGGMSGDVFGNAMIILNKIKLIAAFSSKYIFIDPNPDIKSSFIERERLFNHSLSWGDYDTKKISKGGGVFRIDHKEINISTEIKKLLNLKISKISGSDLAKAILKAKTDMLFFGGINTYIESKTENINGLVVKANDVNAKMIVEGANLGITKKARIEYAKNGGYINGDFIDNCLGVCCSSYEVTLKLLNIKDKDILIKVEKDILKKLNTLSVEKNIGIYLEVFYSKVYTNDYQKYLENFNIKNALSRPEAALLNVSVIHYLKNKYSNIKVDNNYIYNYFPDLINDMYKDSIDNYSLKNKIGINLIINKIVNCLGSYFIFKYANIYNVNELDIITKCIEYDKLTNIMSNIYKDYSNEKIIKNLINDIEKFLEKAFKSNAKN